VRMSDKDLARQYPGDREADALRAEIERLREENRTLRDWQQKSIHYIRDKVDQLLGVVGTSPLRPEELDDDMLLRLDPVGIVSDTFVQILETLRQANEELSLAKNELDAIFHAAGNGIMVLNTAGEVVSYNTKLKDLFLEDSNQLLGRCCFEKICSPESLREACVFDMVMQQGQTVARRNWQSRGRHYDVVGTPIKNRAGDIAQVVLVYNDITERKEAEESVLVALASAEDARAKMDGILQSVADPLIVTDPAHRIIMMNRAAEELLGICLFESRGLPLEDVLADPRLLNELQATLAMENHGGRVDFSMKSPDGGEWIFQGRTSALCDQDGRVTGMITIMQNVTRDREIDRMKSEFISTAAHELQTPLAAIMGFSELLLTQKGALSPEVERESLVYIFDKADLLSKIVDDLLDISRIESGRSLEIFVDGFNFNNLVEQVVRPYRTRQGPHLFEVFLPEEPVEIIADKRKLEQILDNILSNAFKYSPRGGLVRLSVRCNELSCQVSVEDQGIGMTVEQKGRVFDKFYRGDASNTSIGGTGLGMSITKHFVEAHGGRIWVDSESGQGTKVSFEIPVRPKDLVGHFLYAGLSAGD